MARSSAGFGVPRRVRGAARDRRRTRGLEHEGHDVTRVVRLHGDDILVVRALQHLGLWCENERCGAERSARGFRGRPADDGTEGEVSRGTGEREAARIARFVERACRRSVPRERPRDLRSRPPPSVVPGRVSSSRGLEHRRAHFQTTLFPSAIPKRQVPSKGERGQATDAKPPKIARIHDTGRTMLVRFMPMVMLRSQR